MKLNIKLKEARKENNLTQSKIAEMAKITERSYQRIEKGVQDPKTTVSIRLANILHKTVEYLFTP